MFLCLDLCKSIRQSSYERRENDGNSKGEKGRNCVSSEFVQLTCVCKFCTFPVK